MNYATVGESLVKAKGYNLAGHFSSVPVALVPIVSPFDWTKLWDGNDQGDHYFARYGCLNMGWKDGPTAAWQDPFKARYPQSAFTAGTLAPGHVTAPQVLMQLQAICRRPDNPLQLANNASYFPIAQDAQDLLMLVKPFGAGYQTAYEAVIEPLLGGGTVQHPPGPAVPPPPPPPPPAGPPATQPTMQGLPPLTPTAQRVAEVEAIGAEFLHELLGTHVALPTASGWTTILVFMRPITMPLLTLWRTIRRERSGDPRPLP